jgi:hypothetical protein
LNVSVLVRNFGSMHGLLSACCRRPVEVTVERVGRLGNAAVFLDPDIALRHRLLAWMIGEGYDPAADGVAHREFLDRIAQQFGAQHGVNDRTARVWIQFITAALAGYTVFGALGATSSEEFEDLVRIGVAFRNRLRDVEQELGF